MVGPKGGKRLFQRAGRGGHVLELLGCGRPRKTERGATLFVEPVREELHAVRILDLEILRMRLGHVGSRDAGEIVTIHEERHLPLGNARGQSAFPTRVNRPAS